MNHIIKKQNRSEYINFLCAQRYSYTKAKSLFQIRIGLSMLFAIFGPIIIFNFDTTKTYIAITAFFYVLFDFLFLRRMENCYREDGAKIQELFDIGLFNLDWNSLVVGDRPDSEKIFSYSKKYKAKNNLDNLKNWYSMEISNLETNSAVVVCQRTNIWWDVSLREKLFWILLAGLIILTLFIVLIFSRDTVILFSTLFSLLPLYETLGDYVKSQRASIIKIKDLKSKLESLIEKIVGGQTITTTELRTTQDEIFRHRSTCLFVPDSFYFFFRDKQENEMNYSARHYVNRIKNKKTIK